MVQKGILHRVIQHPYMVTWREFYEVKREAVISIFMFDDYWDIVCAAGIFEGC